MLHVAEGSGVVPALGQTGLERTPHILALMMSPPGPRQALEGGRAGGMGPNEGGGRAIGPPAGHTAHSSSRRCAESRTKRYFPSCGKVICMGASQMEIKHLPFGTKFQVEQKVLRAEDVGAWQGFRSKQLLSSCGRGRGDPGGLLGTWPRGWALRASPLGALLARSGPGGLPSEPPAQGLLEPGPRPRSKLLRGCSPAPSLPPEHRSP